MPGTRTRWDPFTELGELRSRLDRPFDSGWTVASSAWTPGIDVVREDGHLVARADLPGDPARGGQDRGRRRRPHDL